jgi:prolyl-tRNA synthetase
MSAGEKFAEADLIGIPWRIVLSPKLGDKVEIKRRTEKEPQILDLKTALELIKKS